LTRLGGRRPPSARLGGLALLAPALLAATPARADDRDPWFGRDKALHFGVSALIAGGGYAGAALASDDARVRVAVGGGLALSAGIAKELWDLSGHGDASWRDLTWDAVGTVTGLAVAAAVDWTIGKLTSRPATGHAKARATAPATAHMMAVP
jgi:putative lipoprotein